MKRIAILGASGHAGRELARLIAGHPDMQVDLLMSGRAGIEPEKAARSYDSQIQALDLSSLAYVDGAFLCTPHLLPLFRGIYATIYVWPGHGVLDSQGRILVKIASARGPRAILQALEAGVGTRILTEQEHSHR